MTAAQQSFFRDLPHMRRVGVMPNGDLHVRGADGEYALDKGGLLRPLTSPGRRRGSQPIGERSCAQS